MHTDGTLDLEEALKPRKGHPKGLYLLFATEMWERFSYYGMRAIFTLYLTKGLLWDKDSASNLYGDYTGLVYLTPLLGGFISDRYWGNRKSILIGGLMMALGQFAMFFSALNYATPDSAVPFMYAGLGLLILGNGFFKPNISTMVGSLYTAADTRRDSAFTIFYMGINMGALFGNVICSILGDTDNAGDFKYGFLTAGVGMILSLIIFYSQKNKYLVTPSGVAVGLPPAEYEKIAPVTTPEPGDLLKTHIDTTAPVEVKKSAFSPGLFAIWGVIYAALLGLFYYFENGVIGSFIFATTIAFPGFIVSDKSLKPDERARIWVIYIVAFFVIFFWMAFEQAGASLTFYADEQVDRMVNLGFTRFEIPASAFQSINALAIILFAPIFAGIWTFMARRKAEPSSPLKMSIGLALLALGYLVIALAVQGLDPASGLKQSMAPLVIMYLLHTFGELALSPIGLSMVNKLAPFKYASLLMGVWFLSTASANKLAGVLSALYPEGGVAKSFLGYEVANLYDFFILFFILAGASSVVLLFLHRWLAKMMRGVR